MSSHDPSTWLVGGGLTLIAVIWLVAILAGLLGTIFWIVEIVDVVRRDFADPNLKIVWLLIIIFFHFVGALVYYFAGKPQGTIPPVGNINRY
jgi:hypothetical protein